MLSAVADFLGLTRRVKFDFEFYDKPENEIPAIKPSRRFGGLFTPTELGSALDAYVDTHNFWRMYLSYNGIMQAVLSNDEHGVRVVGYAPEYSGRRVKAEYANPRVNQIDFSVVANLGEISSYERWVNACFATPNVAAVVLQERSQPGICAAWERTDSGIQMVVNKLHCL